MTINNTYRRNSERVWFFKNGLTNYDSMTATVIGKDSGKLHIVARHPYDPGTFLYGIASGNALIGSELVVSILYQYKGKETFHFLVESFGEETSCSERRYATDSTASA